MSKNETKRKSTFSLVLKRIFLGTHKDDLTLLQEEQMQSPMRTIVKNFLSNKIAMVGAIVFVFIFLACFILPIFFPLDKTYQDSTQQNIAPGFDMMSVPGELKKVGVRAISTGGTFGVGVDNNGKVYTWGKRDKKLKATPKNMGNVVQVSAGMNHILAMNSNGKIFTWGYNRLRLDKVPMEVNELDNVKQIAAGQQISFVLTEDGYIYYWGNDNLISLDFEKYQGQVDYIIPNSLTAMAILKDGSVVSLEAKKTPFSNFPAELEGKKIIDIATTDKSAAALTEDGRVYTWGSSDFDVLNIPESIQGKVTHLEGGRSHVTALLNDGTVTSWGRDNFGQSSAPKNAKNIVSISSGYFQNYAIDQDGKVYTWGLKGYLMGTDGYGRDVFVRLLTGGRMTMTIGAIAVIISMFIGIIIGGFSGYYGGKVDNVLMRSAEIVSSIPFLPFAMILSTLMGNNISELGRISIIMIILGVLSWPPLARLVRAQILAEREKEFVTAAKAIGVKQLGIIFRHILPNVITVIIVNVTLDFASCMLIESSLSFLGFGVIEPSPTWGNMLTGSQSSTVIGTYWWRWVFPAAALSLATVSINLIGDGLRDAIDPRSNER